MHHTINLTEKSCEIFRHIDEMLKTAPQKVVNNTLTKLSKGVKPEEFGTWKRRSFSVKTNRGKITIIIKGGVTKTHITIMMSYLLKHCSGNVLSGGCAETNCPLMLGGICVNR